MDYKFLLHSGVKRKSGRYEWGSGENPYQHEPWFKGWGELRKTMSEKEIGEMFHMSLKEIRYRHSIAKDMEKAANIAHAKELRYNRQMSVKAIAEKMGVSESTVNSWLKPNAEAAARETERIAQDIAKYCKEHVAVDIGKGVEDALGVNKTKLETAIQLLKDQGYVNIQWGQPQQTNISNKTQNTVLVEPDPSWKDMTEKQIKSAAFEKVMSKLDDVVPPYDVIFNINNDTKTGIQKPKSISSDQIEVIYAEDGGTDRDGLIELRRGAEGLDLGNSVISQVRIAVDDTHYIKGVAVYSDNLPPGVDVRIHSNKHKGVPLKSDDPDAKQVLKPIKTDDTGKMDPDDPFGAQIMSQRGHINIVNQEGNWQEWGSATSLASQVLSKQNPEIAKKQLNIDYLRRVAEYEEIKSIENPIVKQKRLVDFGDECDKAAEELKAAALPGQSVKVLFPVPSLKPGECYCPAYKDGEKLALIRYPHQSKSEIPILTVNNSNREGRRMVGNSVIDAIGIHPKDAQRLSGADFDGDTVVVIPNKKNYIESIPEFKGLKGFEPKEQWPAYPGMKVIKHQTQQTQMGVVTNLITDMTLIGASEEEMVRAIKQAQVIIDAEKHKLDWKGSEAEYRIAELHEKYQGKKGGGATTIVAKSSGEKDVPERTKYYKIDPNTGEKIYTPTGRKKVWFTDETTGKKYYKNLLPGQPGYDPKAKDVTQKTTKMMDAKDAYELVSPSKYPMEIVYADYANQCKALANEARKASLSVKDAKYSPQAAEVYAKEVAELKKKVNSSKVGSTLERMAQRTASVIVADKMEKYPDRYNNKTPDGKKHLKKIRSQVLKQQRAILQRKEPFTITDREWEAIQAGALNKTLVREIINRADAERIKELSTPKTSKLPTLSKSSLAHARAMLNAGWTQAQVADNFNISPSTLSRLLKEG